MQIRQLLLQLHIGLLLALYVIFPVNQLHVSRLDALLQLPSPLNRSLDLYIGLLLLHLLL